MKTTIFSILILATLIAWFSFFGENIPYKSQKEGWAFSDGESGTPIPKDGADGNMNVFVISEGNEATPNQTAEQTTAQGKTDFPISVTVEQPTNTADETTLLEVFLCGVGVGALAVEIIMVAVIAAYWLKNKISRRKCYVDKNRKRLSCRC